MRDPSVTMLLIEYPSWVIWMDPVILGELTGNKLHTKPAAINNAARAAASQDQRRFPLCHCSATGVATVTFPELVSRFSLFRSARISAALW